MIVLSEIVPGAGDNWTTKAVIDRTEWLYENVDKTSYKLWWEDRWSDKLYIKFNNESDAMLYKLKWIQDGCIEQ